MRTSKLMSVLNSYPFFVLLYAVILVIALLPYYRGGTIVLGGEGDYVLDFSVHLEKYSFMWHPTYGLGIPNMSPSGTGTNIFLLWLIERLSGSIALTNFLLIFSIFFLPFSAMYLLCRELRATPGVTFLCSLFYVVNPFMLYYLTNLNQWNVFSVVVIPLFFWLILKHYQSSFKLFALFGILSAAFSFAYTNQPMLVIIQISLLMSTGIATYIHHGKFAVSEALKKYGLLLISFLLFNSWWISGLVTTVGSAQKLLPQSFADLWLNLTVGNAGPVIAKSLSLTTIIGSDRAYDFFTFWYGSALAKIITLVPVVLVLYSVLISKDRRVGTFLNKAALGLLLAVLFFVKGNAAPLGVAYNYMFKYIPFFFIFKTPVEKFGLLYVFLFSTIVAFVMVTIRNLKHYKIVLAAFIGYLLFCSVPVLSGNIVPEYKISDRVYGSRRYQDKLVYRKVRQQINNDPSEYRVLSMPGVGNYQVLLPNYGGKYYTGLDPVLTNTNKPFIATQNHLDLIYENVGSANYEKLFGIFNIGKVVLNKELIPWFGTVGTVKADDLTTVFDDFMTSRSRGTIVVYENQDHFLPRVYTSGTSALLWE